MLYTSKHSVRSASPVDASVSLLDGLDLAAMLAMARRHAKLVILCMLLGLAIAAAYLTVAEQQYTSQASILIGNRQVRAVQDNVAQNSLSLESTLVDSEMQVLQSERVLLSTIRALRLTEDPYFNGTQADSMLADALRMVRRLANPLAWFGSSASTVDPAYRIERIVVSRLLRSAKVTRIGKSNIIQVSVTVPSSTQAAAVANAWAEAYLSEQLLSRFDASRRAQEWFGARINELSLQSSTAQLAVEKFRAENNLIATGGVLVADQQLQQMNNDLAEASLDRGRKQARYDSIRTVLARGDASDLVTDALGNNVITQLRSRYTDVSKRLAEISARVGPRHEQAVNLRQQLTQYDRLIIEELRRIESTFKNDLDAAIEREKALKADVDNLNTLASVNNNALVRLRQLEQEANSLRLLHQSFLQRNQETVQQETFPITDARIISNAARALQPSEPNSTLVIAIGLLLGLGVGSGLASWREFGDRAFRSPQQIEQDLGIPVFGTLPVIGQPDFEVAPKLQSAATSRTPKLLARPPVDIGNYTVDHPFSSISETMRASKVIIDQLLQGKSTGKVIGIVSTLPREGKSIVSKNFASLLAMQGSKTMLIDGDLRHAGLTRLVAPDSTHGLVEVLSGSVSVSDAIVRETRTGLNIIPAIVPADLYQSAELMRSDKMAATLEVMTKIYDYIVIDLPPLGPVTDARAAANLIDAFILVVEWGGVPRRVVQETLAASGPVAEKTVGAILNKTEIDRMRLYQPYGLAEQQIELFNKYYK